MMYVQLLSVLLRVILLVVAQSGSNAENLLSPDDIVLNDGSTRGQIEKLFRLKRGSLVVHDDGDAFVRVAENNRWTPYTGIAINKTRTEVFNGEAFISGKQVLYYSPDGRYYVSDFIDSVPEPNPLSYVALNAVFGYSGPNIRLVWSLDFVPKIPDTINFEKCTIFTIGQTKFDDATCSYIDKSDDEVFGYEGGGIKDPCGAFNETTIAAIEKNITLSFGCNNGVSGEKNNVFDYLQYFAFKNVDVFTDKRNDGKEWTPFIIANRDALFEKEKLAPACNKSVEKSKKHKSGKKSKE